VELRVSTKILNSKFENPVLLHPVTSNLKLLIKQLTFIPQNCKIKMTIKYHYEYQYDYHYEYEYQYQYQYDVG